VFTWNDYIYLERRVPALGTDVYVTVDWALVPQTDPNDDWLKPIVADPNDPNVRAATYCFQRDIFPHKPIRQLWDWNFAWINDPTIGSFNYFFGDPCQVQAHPANKTFTNIGQFGELFYNPAYFYGAGPNVGVIEPQLRIDLTSPDYQSAFNYLTVFNPLNYVSDANETRIKGRININTAPWFVLAQLPWISYHTPNYDLARAIVDYRNSFGPFKSTGELMRVADSNGLRDIGYYARDGFDLSVYPDLSTPDLPFYPFGNAGSIDDFEERDAIFARISNLVTVRSDVFTAYILVRIGEDGPQKRVIAILDRSESPEKPVKVIAIQQVPDPR
jgi:hypothetical protein